MSVVQFSNPDRVRRAAPTYSHAAVIAPNARRVLVSEQVGMRQDGSVPEDPAAQIALTFENLKAVLDANDFGFRRHRAAAGRLSLCC